MLWRKLRLRRRQRGRTRARCARRRAGLGGPRGCSGGRGRGGAAGGRCGAGRGARRQRGGVARGVHAHQDAHAQRARGALSPLPVRAAEPRPTLQHAAPARASGAARCGGMRAWGSQLRPRRAASWATASVECLRASASVPATSSVFWRRAPAGQRQARVGRLRFHGAPVPGARDGVRARLRPHARAIRTPRPRAQECAYVCNMAVDERFRRRGYG